MHRCPAGSGLGHARRQQHQAERFVEVIVKPPTKGRAAKPRKAHACAEHGDAKAILRWRSTTRTIMDSLSPAGGMACASALSRGHPRSVRDLKRTFFDAPKILPHKFMG